MVLGCFGKHANTDQLQCGYLWAFILRIGACRVSVPRPFESNFKKLNFSREESVGTWACHEILKCSAQAFGTCSVFCFYEDRRCFLSSMAEGTSYIYMCQSHRNHRVSVLVLCDRESGQELYPLQLILDLGGVWGFIDVYWTFPLHCRSGFCSTCLAFRRDDPTHSCFTKALRGANYAHRIWMNMALRHSISKRCCPTCFMATVKPMCHESNYN